MASKEKSELKKQMDQLDEIVSKMSDSNVSLDELLELYNKANDLVTSIEKLINETEEKINEIISK